MEILKKVLIFIGILCFLSSCNNTEKKDGKNQKTINKAVIKKESIYRVHLYGVFTNDTNQSFWYTENPEEKFDSKRYISKKVKGDSGRQEIIFELPKSEYLEKFRLRLASSKETNFINLDSLVISFNEKRLKVSPKDFKKYLKVNQYVKLDSTTSRIEFGEKEVNGKLQFDPFIISNSNLVEEIFNL